MERLREISGMEAWRGAETALDLVCVSGGRVGSALRLSFSHENQYKVKMVQKPPYEFEARGMPGGESKHDATINMPCQDDAGSSRDPVC